jgi:uncharacterized membrane protein YqjE
MALYHFTRRPPDTIPQPPGTIDSVKQILSAAGRYLDARIRLFSLEASLALQGMKSGLLMFGVAALLLLTAFLTLAAALVLWLTTLLPQANGAAACLAVGGALLLAGFVLVLRGTRSFRQRGLFPVTRTELKSDKQGIRNI